MHSRVSSTRELACFTSSLFPIYSAASAPTPTAFTTQAATPPKSASDHLKDRVAHSCFWLGAGGKARQGRRVGGACFFVFFYVSLLWCIQKRMRREEERGKQTEGRWEKKQNGWRERQQRCVKSIKRISYQGKKAKQKWRASLLYDGNGNQPMYWISITDWKVNNWCSLIRPTPSSPPGPNHLLFLQALVNLLIIYM